MTARDTIALKPCPFCGNRNVAQGASGGYISVWCFCGARGPDVPFPENCDPLPPIKECHAAWNRRAEPTASLHMPAPADGPVPTRECRLHIGQPVRLAKPYPGDDPEAEFYVTGINWEYRSCPARGWNITIASKYDIEKGYGQTDGFAPDDLLSARPKGGA